MSGSKARYLAELEEFELSKADDHRRESGARMSGAGKAVTAVGLIGGGIPGVKPTNSWSYSAAGGSPRGLTVRNLRTGVLGTRIGAHESQVSYLNSKKRGDAYVKGRREGKLIAEHNVLRGMKRAHRGAYGVTAAGLGLVAAGHQRQKVNKADDLKQQRRFGATATTAGLTGGVLAPTLGGFGRHYRKQAAGHLDAAERLAPSGKTKSTVLRRQIGVHHGHAAASEHFADVFHGHAKLFGVVGAGTGALALRQAHKQGVKKGLPELPLGNIPRNAIHASHGKVRVIAYHGDNRFTVLKRDDSKAIAHRQHLTFLPERKGGVGKRDGQPLKTSINEHDAARLVAEHGLTGSLPKHLNREQRMAAYEARYVSAGGHKAHKWQHRANEAEKTRVTGVGAGTAAGAVWLAAHHKRVKARFPALKHKSELALGASGVTAGAGELYGAHARKKRSSYASAPAGVASSALRRMQGYTPQEH